MHLTAKQIQAAFDVLDKFEEKLIPVFYKHLDEHLTDEQFEAIMDFADDITTIVDELRIMYSNVDPKWRSAAERKQRGCAYCLHRKPGARCKFEKCPYRELDKCKTYDEYLENEGWDPGTLILGE